MAEKDFQRAKTDVGFRYGYVFSFDLEEMKKYVEGAFYSNENNSTAMMNNAANSFNIQEFMTRKIMTPGYLSTTHVFPGAFNGISRFTDTVIQNEADFASCLIDHEGKHGQQNYENPNSFIQPATTLEKRFPKIVEDLRRNSNYSKSCSPMIAEFRFNSIVHSWDSVETELEAYENQLDVINSGKRRVSNTFLKSLVGDVNFHRAIINYRDEQISANELYQMVS